MPHEGTTEPEPLSTTTTSVDHGVQRVAWVDLARGMGIFLVVFGHTLRGLMSSSLVPRSGWSASLVAWIYSFHMPLFFALSGLFADKLARKSWGAVLSDRARGVVYPYLVWSTLQTLFQIALSRYTNSPAHASALLRIPLEPVMQFWFLYALLLSSLLYVVLVKAKVPPWAMLLVAVGLRLVPDFGAIVVWSPIGHLKNNFIYYLIGALSSGVLNFRVSRLVAYVGAAIGFAAVTVLVDRSGTNPPLAVGPLTALLGMAAVLLLAMGLPPRPFSFLERWGERSLPIYLGHTLASAGFRIALQRGASVHSPMVHLIGGATAGIALPMLLATLCDRLALDYVFTLRASRRPAH